MLDVIKRNFELFGFLPLDTPAVEEEKTLTGGDPEFKKQIFRIKRESGAENLALRFDLTVPLARVVSLYAGKITFPFKRYQVGSVWRGEKAQAGRFREFLQFDADIVGSASVLADAEIIALMNQVMLSLGFQNFLIKISNRKVLSGLPEYAGFSRGKLDAVLRVVDKLDKIGEAGVSKELTSKNGCGLSKQEARAVMGFFGLRAKNNFEVLRLAGEKLRSGSSKKGLAEMEELVGHLEALGVPAERWAFDFATVRGLAYYTGFVFETILLDLPGIGSVFSGGRYDNLISNLGGSSLPAVGVSVGVDRMFYAMTELRISAEGGRKAKVLVLNFDEKTCRDAEKTVSLLRENGIPSEIYLGNEKGLKGQISYALKNNYALAVMVGADEVSKGIVSIKSFKAYKQFGVKRENLVSEVKKLLEQ